MIEYYTIFVSQCFDCWEWSDRIENRESISFLPSPYIWFDVIYFYRVGKNGSIRLISMPITVAMAYPNTPTTKPCQVIITFMK